MLKNAESIYFLVVLSCCPQKSAACPTNDSIRQRMADIDNFSLKQLLLFYFKGVNLILLGTNPYIRPVYCTIFIL